MPTVRVPSHLSSTRIIFTDIVNRKPTRQNCAFKKSHASLFRHAWVITNRMASLNSAMNIKNTPMKVMFSSPKPATAVPAQMARTDRTILHPADGLALASIRKHWFAQGQKERVSLNATNISECNE